MTGPRNVVPTLARRAASVAAAVWLVTAGACWNGAGVTCPEGDPSCDSRDFAPPPPDAALDLAVPTDLSHPDLSHPDIAMCAATCKSGCCDDKNLCHDPANADFCGASGRMCIACDPLLADQCVDGACVCGRTAPCVAGQRCLGGTCVCDEKSCPRGCCGEKAQCLVPDLMNCGFAGSACLACDKARADGCNLAPQPMPVLPPCSCGGGPACAVGEVCKGATCVCDANACPGCCDKMTNRCQALAWPLVCGAKGIACTSCDKLTSDGCGQNGGCACGAGPACAPGQQCLNKSCVCNPTSCPNGCCAGNVCQTMTSTLQCGTKGAACVACGDGASACVAGVCQCGGKPACDPGQRCQNQACVCDQVSCASGCCDNNNCRYDSGGCGLGGKACAAMCANNQLCIAGLCVPVLVQCAANQALCLGDGKCVDKIKCGACILGGRPGAVCTNNNSSACVGSCKDCGNANKLCNEGNGVFSCTSDCNKCPNPGTCM